MGSLQTSAILQSATFSEFTLFSSNKLAITSALNVPKYLKNPRIIVQNFPKQVQNKSHFIEELNKLTTYLPSKETPTKSLTTKKLYTILEAINDRIEMHHNIGEQRENWNSLLLNSVNMITLTAATMAGLAQASGSHGVGLKFSSTLLFLAGTGILLIMNKIQPSQLVEEQRNAVRLFKRVRASVETTLALPTPTEKDVEEAMEEVLALDKAFPLPLLGAMIEKFPKNLEPAKWWPKSKKHSTASTHYVRVESGKDRIYADTTTFSLSLDNREIVLKSSGDVTKWSSAHNGWTQELEDDIREIVGVTKSKDIEDYIRLGNKALKLNKILAVSGPLLTGIAAIGAAFVGHGGPWAGVVAAAAGSMAAVVNTVEHGAQVGMVFEMYRNCAGFFKLLEETVESTLEEKNLDKRENGEIFELKMALHLGRSLSELREFADKCRKNEGSVDEFASKLF